MPEKVLKYDGSFKGFLTCVFNSYEQKIKVVDILPPGDGQKQLFTGTEIIITEEFNAQRVLKALMTKITSNGLKKIKFAFLSETLGIEIRLYEMIRYIFSNTNKADLDYSNPIVLYISNIAKQVGREKHRMEAFVRFRLTKEDIYFALIEPDFNVLPLIVSHFNSRYADQKWLIYDVKRKFGVYYDLTNTEYISIDLPKKFGFSGGNSEYFETKETYYQKLWKEYFESTNIKSRVNMRLHAQHVPKRYWKYLIEKCPFA